MQHQGLTIYLTETPLFHPINTLTGPFLRTTLSFCLSTIQSFFAALFAVRADEGFKFTYLSWAPVSHVLLSLAKLSLLQSPDWDLGYAKEQLDLVEVLDRIIVSFRRMSVANALFERIVKRFSGFKEAFEKKRGMVLGVVEGGMGNGFGEGQTVVGDEGVIETQNGYMSMGMEGVLMNDFSQLGDGFWEEMMGDWQSL